MEKQIYTCQTDQMGRLVIPLQIRKVLNIPKKSIIDFIVADNKVMIKPHTVSSKCEFCGKSSSLIELSGKHICTSCLAELNKK